MLRLYASMAVTMIAAFMSELCETVTIKTENGPVRINKTDFDETKHELDTEANLPSVEPANAAPVMDPAISLAPSPSAVAPVAPAIPAPGQLGVKKDGKKFYVVQASDGVNVEDRDGIDKAGYPDEATAWAAVMALTPTA